MTAFFVTTPHSYGVIPLRKTKQGIECLLINQIDYHKKGTDYWTFPKGTPEAGETPLQTAIRETREEVGILCDPIDDTFSYYDHYAFTVGQQLVEKTVTYYIGVATGADAVPQQSEVRECVWLPLADARAKLTNDHARQIIDAIRTHLRTSRLFKIK
jgi:8-oxo-dGTP pyrophosphatase MutT (NUDIX family)